MNFKPLKFDWKQEKNGQSFVELALVFSILLTLMAGMVEFGNMLNQYINIIDGAREGARFGSNDDPFGLEEDGTTSHYENFFNNIYQVVEGSPTLDASGNKLDRGAIRPMLLDPATDDIVVSFFSVTGNPDKGLVRFQSAIASRYQPNHTSQFTDEQVLDMVDGDAPSTGILLVEVFYSYNQILKLFRFTGIPDPIELHAYSIMPLSAAEPTPTPSH